MPLKYKLVHKPHPTKPEEPKKIYAKAVHDNIIDIRTLAKEISTISTISPADTAAMIESLIQIIPDHVINGDIVSLGDFGTFALNIKSDGAESEKAFLPSKIKGVKLLFRPGKVLKQMIRTVTFQKVS